MSKEFTVVTLEELVEASFKGMLEGLVNSAVVMVVAPAGDIDPKITMEVGAAVLLGKPLLVMVPEGSFISANLQLVADTIIDMPKHVKDWSDEEAIKVSEAVNDLVRRKDL